MKYPTIREFAESISANPQVIISIMTKLNADKKLKGIYPLVFMDYDIDKHKVTTRDQRTISVEFTITCIENN